jgi:hypothetical protein
MFLTNAMKGTLTQYNRVSTGVYDDEYKKTIPIKLCPYNQDIRVAFGTYTIPEAEGYYIVKSNVNIKEGDQITFQNKTYTVLKVKDNWIWNRIENYTVAVK